MAAFVVYDDGIFQVIASGDGTLTTKKYDETRAVLNVMDIQDIRDTFDEDPHVEHRESELAEQRIKGGG